MSKKINIDGTEFELSEDFDSNMHPLDALFGMPPSVVDEKQEQEKETVVPTIYDEKDKSLDEELDEIVTLAKESYEHNSILVDQVEPKFRGEIITATNNILNTALQAIKEKAELKKHKDKLVSRNSGKLQIGNSENTNIIIADRNELLRQMRNKKED